MPTEPKPPKKKRVAVALPTHIGEDAIAEMSIDTVFRLRQERKEWVESADKFKLELRALNNDLKRRLK